MARFAATQARSENLAVIDRVSARLAGLSEKNQERAIARTLASGKRRFETTAKRIIRTAYNVRLKDLAGKFQVRTGQDNAGEFVSLLASTKPLPLIGFGGVWKGRKTKGATATIRLGEVKVYASAFIATINGTKRMVARQFIRGGGGKRDPRNKLRTLTGPSPYQMVEGVDQNNAIAIAADVNDFLITELQRQIKIGMKER